jgi:hypothetical protein
MNRITSYPSIPHLGWKDVPRIGIGIVLWSEEGGSFFRR